MPLTHRPTISIFPFFCFQGNICGWKSSEPVFRCFIFVSDLEGKRPNYASKYAKIIEAVAQQIVFEQS